MSDRRPKDLALVTNLRSDISATPSPLKHVSPSQVTDFLACARRWYNKSVLGIVPGTTIAQQRGTDIHAEIEHYLEHRVIRTSPHEKLVHAAKPTLDLWYPAGDSSVSVEQWIELPTYVNGPKMKGRYDGINFSQRRVGDVKSTSDIRRYGKKPHEVATHPQLNVYGKHLLDKLPDAEDLTLGLLFVQTRGAATAMAVEATRTRAEVEETWNGLVSVVAQMDAHARKGHDTAESLPPNTGACDDYGGCPYRRLCGLQGPVVEFTYKKSLVQISKQTEDARVAAVRLSDVKIQRQAEDKGETKMGSLFERMQAETEGKVVETKAIIPETKAIIPETKAIIPKTKAVIPETKPPIADTKVAPEKCAKCNGTRWMDDPNPNAPKGAKIKCSCTQNGASTGQSAAPVPKISIKVEGDDGKLRPLDPNQIMPEDAPSRETSPEYLAEVTGDAKAAAKASEAGLTVADHECNGGWVKSTEAGAPPGAFLPCPQCRDKGGAPLEKPKRGRKPKAAVSTLEGPAAPEVVAAELLAAPGVVAALEKTEIKQSFTETRDPDRAVKTNDNGRGLVLFVDCLPSKGHHASKVVNYEDWLAPIMQKVALEHKDAKGNPSPVQDWRQISYTAEGDLAAEIRAQISSLPLAVHVSGESRARAPFLESAIPWATEVVRGV